MAAPFITIDRANPNVATHAARLLNINSQVKQLREAVDSLVAEGFQMFDGDVIPDKFAVIKTKFGLGTNEEAHSVFDMLNGAKLMLDGTTTVDGQPVAVNQQINALATKIG